MSLMVKKDKSDIPIDASNKDGMPFYFDNLSLEFG